MRPVQSAADLSRFIDLPYKLHRDDPLWVPPLRRDVRVLLSRDRNPFFEHAEVEYFLAEQREDGRTGGRQPDHPSRSAVLPSSRRTGARWRLVGRIAAIHNRAHNAFHEDSVGFFGFFETVDHPEVAHALFDAAAEWLKARGLTVMRGPASFSTNDECGLLVDGFDTPPTILNPHNPPYYVPLVEGAGFTKAEDLYQYQSRNPNMPERLLRAAEMLAQRQRITLRPLDKKRFDGEVEKIKTLYNAAWERNWGFVPMTDAEIDHLAAQLKPVVVPDVIVFAEKDGETIGFAAALPDLNVALKANPSGRLFPFGLIKILWASRRITRLRILLLGLLKEYRKTGADALMYHWIWEKGRARGFDWGEAGWVLEDNMGMRKGIERVGFEHYKTLRMYDRPL